MFEEENGYEVVHKMTESSEDLASLPTASGEGDRNKIERIRSNGIRSNEIDMLKIFT